MQIPIKLTEVNKKTLEKILSPKYRLITAGILLLDIFFIFSLPLLGFFLTSFLFVYFAIIKKHIQKDFMSVFASLNNLKYQDSLDAESLSGEIFEIGRNKKALNVLSGEYLKYPVKIFNYSYVVNQGRNNVTYSFTICEVEITKTQFPKILLKSRTMLDFVFTNKRKIKLEEEFEKDFSLYCTEDYEIETLQIFTPETLRYLRENGKHFSIEFSQNKIYFYDDVAIGNTEEINKLYDVVKRVLDNSGPLLQRLHDDFGALNEVYSK